MNACVCFCLSFRSGAVPRMGLRPVAPAPFGSCLYIYIYIILMLFIYVEYLIKLLRKQKQKKQKKILREESKDERNTSEWY